jgi:non-specific serine/threonine protein kinase
MGWCEVSFGWVKLARGASEEAAERFERAVELGRRVVVNAPTAATRPVGTSPAAALEASPLLLAHALGSLAPLAARAGDEERASTLAAEGVEMARVFGLATFLLMTLTRATEVGILFRRWPSAEATLRESLALLRDTGAQAFLADSLEMTALLGEAGRSHISAARLFGAAERVREVGGESADVRCISSELEQCRSRLTKALPEFDQEWARGKRLSPSEAVAYALQELEAGPTGAGVSAVPRSAIGGVVIPAVMRQQDKHWLVRYGAATFELPDMKGLHYLARLLAQPCSEVHVLDLTGGQAEDAGPVLDERAKREYGRRVRELQGELEEAESWNDSERVARAQLELDALTRQLAAAVGLGGRNRPSGSSAERARVSVRKAIAKAIAHVADHDADLALLLSTTVKTGSYCSYVPDPRLTVDWSL